MLLTTLICQLIQRQSAPKAKNASLSDTNSTPNQHPGDEYSPRCRFNSVGLFLFSEPYKKNPNWAVNTHGSTINFKGHSVKLPAVKQWKGTSIHRTRVRVLIFFQSSPQSRKDTRPHGAPPRKQMNCCSAKEHRVPADI